MDRNGNVDPHPPGTELTDEQRDYPVTAKTSADTTSNFECDIGLPV
jgi:hypothetical protein